MVHIKQSKLVRTRIRARCKSWAWGWEWSGSHETSMEHVLPLFMLQLLLFREALGEQFEISLSGGSWSLSDSDGKVKAIKARVPGTVHLDLMYVLY